MTMRKKLFAGDRFLLEEDKSFWQVVSGSVEVYATTQKGGEISFHQCYLLEKRAGEAVFPALDDFQEVRMQIYALEDCELELFRWQDVDGEYLRQQMEEWFFGLVQISWLRLLADKGDDMLQLWKKRQVLAAATSNPEIYETFIQHESILSMLLWVRFGASDKRLARRIRMRDKSKIVLVENGIRSLLGEEQLFDGGKDIEHDKALWEEATFAVRQVAAALKMPVDFIGLEDTLTRDWDEVAILRRLMQKGNMQMRLVTLPDNWYKRDSGVLLGFYTAPDTGAKEIAALIPMAPDSYRVFMPQHPEGIALSGDEAQNVSRDAFQCYAGFPARALKLWDLIKFMFHQCWLADYRTILICSLFAGLIPLATPLITETIFQDIIPILDRQGLATVTQALMVTSFTTAALGIVRSIAVLRIANRIEMSAEAAMWGRLMSLPTKFFRRFTVGELASRMGGIGIAKGLASGEFVSSILSFVFSFWSIFLMCYYSMKLTAAAIVVWLVYSLFVAIVLRRVLFFQRKIIEAGNKSAGTVQQIFAGLPKFRVQGAEEQAYNLWTRTFGEHWNWTLKLRWQNNYTSIISSIQPFVLTLILYYIAVYGMNEVSPDGKIVNTGIGYAQFIAFNAAYSSFNGVMGGVIGLVSQYFAIQPQLENLRPILEAVPETTEEKQEAGQLSGAIEVSHLSFAYTHVIPDQKGGVEEVEGEDVLKDVSFSIAAGENVAIVGRSGSGKSTLVRLLLGFEMPKRGSITFDGQDLSELALPSVRSQMGVVLQNGQLMTGDIYTNIVGTRMLPQEAAWAAAEAAGIAEDIADMPMGMQTIISEGSSNISGGQRQRILIARALVGNPAILILDEATSALDNRSQAIVTRSLDKLKSTRIVVAHRLSTIRQCDRVIVMDDGRIAEMGSFDELLAKGGLFAELVKRQVTGA
ncbi:NHLP bacteriocin export ABC transporter permease/ATPase subunit [Selenomonas caprae]|uniref:NHLP bacteriocin export ABC transporter permease/ATPase subunit n=1 Tax=Selenomonas caprae TaxID=2606905 RepID=A0A5D6WVV1_9FIRM|nr:NHLP bacteriocin export ABC transporter permease/ATPase subunit [Selenomonas caprae]TYZ31098.1 NHLP bacteriocin export ABC transporter permease/ATPase subunit [Selenomonas caprae]